MRYGKKEVISKLKDLEKELGRRPSKRDDNYLYWLSREHFGSWNKMMISAGHSCKVLQRPIIPKEPTGNLYYFLGLVSTDGHIQALIEKWSYRIMIYTSEKEEKEMILHLIDALFRYKASVRSRKTGFSERPNYEIYVSSKKVADFLHSLGIPFGAKSQSIIVPESIIKCSTGNFWHYLRGVFDGDGSIIFSKSNKIFKITSGSLKFLEGLRVIMVNRGFDKAKIWKQTESVWELRINNSEDIKRIYQLIYKNATFFYPRKRTKWEKQYI